MQALKILVVDDELGMRQGVIRVLRNYRITLPELAEEVSFAIETAETAEVALDLIQKDAPDIMLLDHKLPGMQGLELLEIIVRDYPDLLTIVITAYASLEIAISATKKGAYDFLAKPFTPEELKSTIGKATRHIVASREARRLGQERKKLRFQLISVVAHELKAPLAAIESYLRIISDGTAGDDIALYRQMAARSVVRVEGMRKLIVDLLDLTRIESGQSERNLQQLDLAELAARAAETFAAEAAERNIELQLNCADELPMIGDVRELEIIFNNLISNAIKYNRNDGRVEITVNERDGQITISVSDTGIGMTAEETTRLFGEFVRIKNEKTEKISGSGLGLSIVKKLAGLYGGTAEVTSVPDEGSQFTVKLKSSSIE